MVYKGDIIELPAPSREVLDLDDEDFEDSEMAAPCNTPRIVFPLEFTAPPEQPAHPVRNPDDDPDVLEAVEAAASGRPVCHWHWPPADR